MKKIIIKTLLLCLLLTSCNKDVELIKSRDNFECRRLATCFRFDSDFDNSVARNSQSVNLDYERIKYGLNFSEYKLKHKNNLKLLENTNNIVLVNHSKTKVYEVRIQRTDKGVVSYEDVVIEPTSEICIGCNVDFDLDIERIREENSSWNLVESKTITHEVFPYEGNIKNLRKIEYKIHNFKVIQKY